MAVSRIQIAGLIGSLRTESFNRGLYRYAVEAAPPGVDLFEVPIGDLPLYNEDLGAPRVIERFWEALRPADAVLFVTPEYNYSIPAPLKNAVDWASRDPLVAALHGKPAAVMGASPGQFGTVRAQTHLRSSLAFLDMQVISKPEVLVTQALTRFDASHTLTDTVTQDRVRALIERLADRVREERTVAVGA